MFDAVDFKDCEVLYCEDSEIHKEDLLLLKCKNGRLIDVGWYNRNKYCIMVIQDEQWDNPCYQISKQPKIEYIEYYLQKIIDYETTVFEAEVWETLGKITNAIDCGLAYQGNMNDIIAMLERLRDMGLQQNKAADYILVYALKYQEANEDEEKWDMACDILDRITGYCSLNLRIWHESG